MYKQGENWGLEGGGGERDVLFTFVLLNRGVPDVKSIYFVSIEQKEIQFFTEVTRCVSYKKDEVICSANK